jgi:hypothetical protein
VYENTFSDVPILLTEAPDAADAERFASLATMPSTFSNLTCRSPLKPAELQVLRAQYDKEGEYVGVQTKFNYAWVGRPHSHCSEV